MYSDERFRLEMKLWSKFAFNKIDKSGKFYKKKFYQFSQQLKRENGSYYFSDYENFKKGMVSYPLCPANKVSSKKVEIKLPVGTYYSEFVLDDGFKKKFTIEYLYKGNVIESVKYKNIDTLIYTSEVIFDQVNIQLRKKAKKKSLPISLRYYDYKVQTLPMFTFINDLKHQELEAKMSYYYSAFERNSTNAVVFYRYSKEEARLKSKKFTLKNTFKLSEIFTPQKSGFYEFFISYDVVQPSSSITDLEFKTVGN